VRGLSGLLRDLSAGRVRRRRAWLIAGVVAFGVVYAAVALPTGTHQNQRFPFYAWELFDRVPDQRFQDFSVRFIDARGARVPLPAFFEEARMFPIAVQGQGFTLIQRWGTSIARGERIKAEIYRKRFESRYLGPLTNVRYQVVRRTYDPRERAECRSCFKKLRVVATYTTS